MRQGNASLQIRNAATCAQPRPPCSVIGGNARIVHPKPSDTVQTTEGSSKRRRLDDDGSRESIVIPRPTLQAAIVRDTRSATPAACDLDKYRERLQTLNKAELREIVMRATEQLPKMLDLVDEFHATREVRKVAEQDIVDVFNSMSEFIWDELGPPDRSEDGHARQVKLNSDTLDFAKNYVEYIPGKVGAESSCKVKKSALETLRKIGTLVCRILVHTASIKELLEWRHDCCPVDDAMMVVIDTMDEEEIKMIASDPEFVYKFDRLCRLSDQCSIFKRLLSVLDRFGYRKGEAAKIHQKMVANAINRQNQEE
ncbi:MAG: hypothetical protein Q9160_006938 [Pyrenula sp. 1 TL-2023]